MPFTFEWDFAVEPGSLPSLRFPKPYRIRARVADVAGGGHRLGDPEGDRFSTDWVPYRRHEPVPPPMVPPPVGLLVTGEQGHEELRPDVLGPGGAIDQLVIRSDRGLAPAEFSAQHPRYPANHSRELLPPPTTLALAEQHGKLDGADDYTWQLADGQSGRYRPCPTLRRVVSCSSSPQSLAHPPRRHA